MKHDWLRNPDGFPALYNGEQSTDDQGSEADGQHAVCRACGTISRCGTLDSDCPGLATDVTIAVVISHPGLAAGFTDRHTATLKSDFPLTEVVAAGGRELLELALTGLATEAVTRWRHEYGKHRDAWRHATLVSPPAMEPTLQEVAGDGMAK